MNMFSANRISNMSRSSFFVFSFFITLLVSPVAAFAIGEDMLYPDSTLFILSIIFIGGIYVLNKFFFKPLVEIRYQRENLTVDAWDEYKKLNKDLEVKIKEYEDSIHNARQEAHDRRAEMKREAQQAAEKIVSDAKAEADNIVEQYKKELHTEADRIREKLKPEIQLVAKEVATKVLAREV